MRLVVGGSDRQLVAAIVLHGVGMPLDPDEADVVMPVHAQEAHPQAGDDLVFIEAMKMETPVKAPQDGTVATVDVAKGESVDSGKVLVTLN